MIPLKIPMAAYLRVIFDDTVPIGCIYIPPRGGYAWQCFHGKRRRQGWHSGSTAAWRALWNAWDEACSKAGIL